VATNFYMRDVKRIKPFLKEFEKIWSKYPDMRFGQIVKCISVHSNTDLFYIEEDSFKKLMQRFEAVQKTINSYEREI
jgi:hypothetical protein